MQKSKLQNWPTKKLAELIEVIESGKRPKGGATSGGVPSLGVEHITDQNSFKLQNLKYIPEDFFNSLTKGKINRGDILIAKDGATTGKTAYVPDNFPYTKLAANEHLFILRGKESLISQKFLFYFLFSPTGQTQILKAKHGAAQGGIDQSFVNFVKTPLPPINVQRQIVERLDAIKKAQELNDKQIALAEEFFQNTLHKELKSRNKNWKIRKLSDIVEILYGEGLLKSDRMEDGKYFAYGSNGPVYRTNKILVNYPTIVIGRKGSAGALYLVKDHSWPIDTTFYTKIKNEKIIDLDFLFFFLKTKNLQNLVIVTAVPGINRSSLYNLKVTLPSFKIQRQIVAKLQAVHDYKKKLIEQRTKLKELFDSVLHKEMKGV